MKKHSYYPIYILVISLILGLSASFVEIEALSIKLSFAAKIGLVVGFIGLWLFTILPMWKEKRK